MTTQLPNRVAVEADVLFRELEGEMVLLNLKSESYYGLDDVGARMWQLLTESTNVETAFEALKAEYEVAEDCLQNDMATLITKLVDAQLLKIVA